LKRIFLFALLVPALFFSFERFAKTQTKPEKTLSEQDKNRPELIALKSGEPDTLAYDAGTVRFLASSEDTNGAWSLVELKEMPGYHTNLHRHNNTDEAFYVLEGVLTVKINDKTSDYPAGSYVLIPRGTSHAQGNRGKIPVKVLLTMTPGGFEQSFKDRVELFKTAKPTDTDFRKKREENRIKGKYDVERLADWELPK
jgi:quercetin dioxygenase-like cupin family protein